MKAIILVAGPGNRMGVPYPKCMTDIGGETILNRQLRLLRKYGIDNITLVGGYKNTLLPQREKITINQRWKETNNLYSFLIATKSLCDNILYLHGDLVFDEKILKNLLEENRLDINIVADKKYNKESMTIKSEGGELTKIGKSMRKADGDFIGMAKINITGLLLLLRHSPPIVWEKPMAYFAEALQKLADSGHKIGVTYTDKKWIECDTKEDVKKMREMKWE